MRRWLGVGGGLLVLLGVLWWLRSPARWAGEEAGPPPERSGAASREALPVNALLTTPVAPGRGDLFIRGRVVGRSGPLAGVVVVATAPRPDEVLDALPCDCDGGCERTLFAPTCGTAAQQLVGLVAERRGEAAPQARTTTDAEGRFSLEGLEAGAYAVWADGPPGTGLVEDVAAGSEGVEVRLGEGFPLAGEVRDEDGAQVRGVLVTALHREHSRYFEVLTGEDGHFRFESLPPADYSLVFSREGLLPEHREVDEELDSAVEVMMFRPQRLTGRVVRGGAPVAGVRVRAEGAQRVLDTASDAEGRFAFEGLEPSAYALTASHEGEDAAEEVVLEPQVPPPEVELVLGGGVRVRGTVRDAQGRPIADAEVAIWAGGQRRGADWTTTRTGADGTYSLGPVAPGRYQLKARAARFLALVSEEYPVDGVTPVDFQLTQAEVVEGRVVDAAGAPIAGAWLWLSKREDSSAGPDGEDSHPEDPEASIHEATSDEEGAFVLGVPEAGTWYLKARHKDFVAARLRVAAPQQDVRVVLGAGSDVTGTVTDEQGTPVRAANIYLMPREKGADAWRQKQTDTDSRGRFTLHGVAEGAYSVAVQVYDRAGQRTAVRTVEVRGPEAVHVQLQLTEGLEVSGVVVDTQGQPIPGASVVGVYDLKLEESAEPYDSALEHGPALAKSDKEGRFTLRHLEPGTWKVSARHEHYAPVHRGPERDERTPRVQAGATDVRLELQRMELVRGRVAREDGSPVTRFEVNGRTQLDTEGAFTLPVYKPGQARLFFSARGLASTSRTVRVAEGETLDVGTVVMKKGREVRGRVTDAATGAPVAGALVEVREAPPTSKGRARAILVSERDATKSGRDGTFSLPNVEDGASLLLVVHPGFLPASIPLEPHQYEVAVALDPGAIVRGAVRGASEGPWLVELRSPDGSFNESTALRDGRYELKAVPPGTYVLRIQPDLPRDNPPVFLPRYVEVPASGVVTVDAQAQDAGATVRLRLAVPPGEDIIAMLVPGQVPMPGSFEQLERSMGLHFRAQHAGDGVWTFQRVPAGPYTAFVFRLSPQGVSTHREELAIPAEGELDQALTPSWRLADFALVDEDADGEP
jgi:protocatechuate 3,4-dioxygenase beta subunit